MHTVQCHELISLNQSGLCVCNHLFASGVHSGLLLSAVFLAVIKVFRTASILFNNGYKSHCFLFINSFYPSKYIIYIFDFLSKQTPTFSCLFPYFFPFVVILFILLYSNTAPKSTDTQRHIMQVFFSGIILLMLNFFSFCVL